MKLDLKTARVRVRLTQEEAAKLIGVNLQTIHRWEKKKNKPNLKYLSKILEVYKIESNQIFFN